jgi:hypothetical protein
LKKTTFNLNVYKIAVFILLLGILVAVGGRNYTAKSNAQQFGELFSYSSIQGTVDRTDDPTVLRSRFVNVNFDILETQGDLILNLFSDLTFTAEFERMESVREGSRSWIGRLAGYPSSAVVLVARDGLLTGNINLPGGFYQVRYAGDGVHAIYEIDQTAFPAEAEPIPVEPLPGEGASVEVQGGSYDDGSSIDVMVVYTASARSAFGGTTAMQTLIDLAITESNTGYGNSDVTQRMNLVHTEEVSYNESGVSYSTTLSRLKGTSDGYMDDVHTLRDTYAADHVVLIFNNSAYCGMAYLMTTVSTSFASSAFALVHYSCATGYYSFAHELGHNMGSHHDHANASGPGAYVYSFGYQEPTGDWRTVMAYNCPSGCTRLNYWSNPDVDYGGKPMGVGGTGSDAADNHKSLNDTAYTCANFRTCNIPGIPTLAAPGNGSSTNDPTPLFDWDDLSYASEYQIQIDNNADFLSPEGTGTPTASDYTPSTLPDDTYYWRVRGYNKYGSCDLYGDWSSAWTATIDTIAPPIPTLVSPSDESTTTDNTLDFNWDDSTGAVQYQIQIDNDSDFSSPTLDELVSVSNYTSTALAVDAYSWRVRARDTVDNWSNYSSTWSVTIEPVCSVPSTPTLLSPSDGSTTHEDAPLFDWNDATDASEYQIQIDNNSDFSSPEDTGTQTISSYTPASLADDTYYWQVRGHNTNGGCDEFGDWSSVWSLTIDTSTTGVGLYVPTTGQYRFKNTLTTGVPDHIYTLWPIGGGVIPIVGDWDGNDTVTAGLYNPANSQFRLRNSPAGAPDYIFKIYANGGGLIPLVGDWDGNGTETVGVYEPTFGTFRLRNTLSTGVPDHVVKLWPIGGGVIPLVGDWDGNGTDTLGLYNPAKNQFRLRNALTTGAPDYILSIYTKGGSLIPLVGDWDGDGTDTVGIYESNYGFFRLRNALFTGTTDHILKIYANGGGLVPLVGDWDGNGTETVGIYEPVYGKFRLKDTLTTGVPEYVLRLWPFGGGVIPLTGDWDGN